MLHDDLENIALNSGANASAIVDVADIRFLREFRAACEQNLCGKYGRCYMCPPDVGDIDEMMERAKTYKRAFVFQTIGTLEDSFDIKGMEEAAKSHNRVMEALAEQTAALLDDQLMIGAGACQFCDRCSKLDELPCHYPDKAITSLEAYGIAVSELASLCGIKYINGQNTVTYFGVILFGRDDVPTVTTIQNGKIKIIRAKKDALLSFVLGDGGVHIDMPCGGKGTCRKCLVKISGQYCLACQTKIDSDIEVEIQNDNAFGQILDGGEITRKGECPMYTKYSLAIDIGTTTICASIIGLDGAYEAEVLKNPQTVFGADVISRIERALGGGLPELAESVQTALNGMISRLANRQRISPEEIDAAVITGNTAMLYLLSGLNPETLSRAPFEADHLFGEYVPAELLGFGISKFASIYLPRCISAFVGADITTAILASGMCEDVTTSLLADIGTNGELALWHNGVLHCASTAAGPAFEGGGLSCGVYGVTGAIDKVWLDDGKICSSTIGGVPAVGICGSGIVDALAMMLELGIIDETGAFENGEALELQDGVQVTSQDVRKIQLAKGSIRAGIETLLETSGLNKSEIGTLYISGGFGNYLDLNSAAAIGLIPPELLPVTKCIGNAAHIGAAMLLQDKSLIEKAIESAKSAKTVPLDANPVFTDNYMRHMMFGQG